MAKCSYTYIAEQLVYTGVFLLTTHLVCPTLLCLPSKHIKNGIGSLGGQNSYIYAQYTDMGVIEKHHNFAWLQTLRHVAHFTVRMDFELFASLCIMSFGPVIAQIQATTQARVASILKKMLTIYFFYQPQFTGFFYVTYGQLANVFLQAYVYTVYMLKKEQD